MGYCTDKFAVLDNWAAAHALNNASGFRNQPFVVDFNDEILVVALPRVHFDNGNFVFLGTDAVNRRIDERFSDGRFRNGRRMNDFRSREVVIRIKVSVKPGFADAIRACKGFIVEKESAKINDLF